MAMNRIQFQQGMSLPEFMRSFGTEEQCAQAVFLARWPEGFRCPRCQSSAHCRIGPGGRLYQCNACHHHRLHGAVQLDDAYLGGERSGGKVGRGSENKVPFVAAVSLSEEGNPLYVKLARLSGFTSQAVGDWARAALVPGTMVTSDGLGCFAAVTDAGCLHSPIVVGQRKPRDLPEFTWVNTVLGNLKTTLAGAFHAFDYAKYAGSYLAAFAYRFNRRFDLRGLVARLVIDVVRAKPKALRSVRQAELHCS
jgi:ribosomal protein L37AE/L43A